MSRKAKKKPQEFNNFNLSPVTKNIIMVLLILVSLLVLGLLFVNLFGGNDQAAALLDNAVSLLFLALFALLYRQAIDKNHFFSRNWWILIGALPIPSISSDSVAINAVVGILLLARFSVRLVLLVKVSHKIIPHFYALQVVTVLGFFTLLSTELFYMAEHATNPEVQTHFDSFWWTMVTTTTVGYGDIAPVTTGGRIIAIFMMLMGIGIVGLVTGSAASFLTKRIRSRYDDIDPGE